MEMQELSRRVLLLQLKKWLLRLSEPLSQQEGQMGWLRQSFAAVHAAVSEMEGWNLSSAHSGDSVRLCLYILPARWSLLPATAPLPHAACCLRCPPAWRSGVRGLPLLPGTRPPLTLLLWGGPLWWLQCHTQGRRALVLFLFTRLNEWTVRTNSLHAVWAVMIFVFSH